MQAPRPAYTVATKTRTPACFTVTRTARIQTNALPMLGTICSEHATTVLNGICTLVCLPVIDISSSCKNLSACYSSFFTLNTLFWREARPTSVSMRSRRVLARASCARYRLPGELGHGFVEGVTSGLSYCLFLPSKSWSWALDPLKN